jgi:hypothetical protein
MLYNKSRIIIFKGNVVCPRCDGNGLIYKALLTPIHQEIFICDECDAMWLSPCIDKGTFQNFTTYIESFGYSYDEVELENVVYDWYKKENFC